MTLTVRAGSIRPRVLTALLVVVWTTVGAGGPRVVVKIDEPFMLQGQVYPAGTISIRAVSQYNPTSMLHEVCIEDQCLGVFLAERIDFETDDQRDTFRFERNAEGTLVLLGYTLHRKGRAEFHRFAPSPNTPTHLMAHKRGLSGFSSNPSPGSPTG